MAAVDAPRFDSPEQVESAFYEAFQALDLDAMMATWSEEDDIVCIHPQGPRLEGYDQIRDSWAQILGNSPPIQLRLSDQRRIDDDTFAVHYVNENIYLATEKQPQFTILATNIYRRTSNGWRIVLHHASPTPESLSNLERKPPRSGGADVTVH